jgi:sulfoxide reductase heme-binding subunit YedZ
MISGPKEILQGKALNQWNLFWLISLPISLAVVIKMAGVELNTGENVSSMIQFSVRCSVPFLYLAFAASSIHALFPSLLSRWLLRNRKIMGLCFAAAMAWQLLFILWMVGLHTQYYAEDVYVLSDVIEGVLGYLFLIAMTLTSFKFGRARLSNRQWKVLHKYGIYYLWGYAWSVYWFELFYYENPDPIDYAYYWAGFLAWALRIWAWSKKQRQQAAAKEPGNTQPLLQLASVTVIVIGLAGSIFGSTWSPPVYRVLESNEIILSIQSIVPYFPFVPFYPGFVILCGALFAVKSRT